MRDSGKRSKENEKENSRFLGFFSFSLSLSLFFILPTFSLIEKKKKPKKMMGIYAILKKIEEGNINLEH
jgi:hypothetical protein